MPPTFGGKSLVTRRWRFTPCHRRSGETGAAAGAGCGGAQPACVLKRNVGTRPARSSMRIARASSASMTTASSGSRSRRKLTTQSSQATVWRSAQQSQSIVSPPAGAMGVSMSSLCVRLGVGIPGSRHDDDPLCRGQACPRGVTPGTTGLPGGQGVECGLQCLLEAPGHALGAHAVGRRRGSGTAARRPGSRGRRPSSSRRRHPARPPRDRPGR